MRGINRGGGGDGKHPILISLSVFIFLFKDDSGCPVSFILIILLFSYFNVFDNYIMLCLLVVMMLAVYILIFQVFVCKCYASLNIILFSGIISF